jgi:pimeloyl-ACP methyl ester carboxylesterase
LALVTPARDEEAATMTVQPFRIDIPDRELTELRDRLAGARWAAQPPGAEGDGVSVARVRELAGYWRERYDWRVWEARLNAYPQFITTIDGTSVHFLHIRSGRPDALPLVLLHGWPGSIAEYLDVIGPLTDPDRPGPPFDLVIPSLPGFGFSGPTPDTGWGPRRIAQAIATLMQRLGYRRYGAVGNDWGSFIAPELGRAAPDAVIGVHVTQIFSPPDGESSYLPPTVDPPGLTELSKADQDALQGWRYYQRHLASYYHVHAQQPATLGHALADSPVGLLGWNCQVMTDLDVEMLLTHVSVHWFTGTGGSAIRIYAEQERQPPPDRPSSVPLGLANFAADLPAIRRYAERDHRNIVSWHTYDRGGHYAARQVPELLVADVRGFFAALLG